MIMRCQENKEACLYFNTSYSIQYWGSIQVLYSILRIIHVRRGLCDPQKKTFTLYWSNCPDVVLKPHLSPINSQVPRSRLGEAEDEEEEDFAEEEESEEAALQGAPEASEALNLSLSNHPFVS
ncbi:hypothetical protein O181_039242 [Austropuccinia psidii MF-1]|uniref:Uncharacterized protein n=1 Tax=Austropuccinia psidii MF-1 TaxID=1389203 RepID=A0A9Q3HCQ1_9BASI|nr:hypothetical protein [Austropuccinia psidii MF-1]